MRLIGVYLLRIVLCAVGCGIVLRFSYGPRTEYDQDLAISYVVVCSILALCALLAWVLRLRRSRSLEVVSSAAIAMILCFALIRLSELADLVVGMPWQYFYKDDYIVVFQLIAPITVAVFAGILSLIPERPTHSANENQLARS
ncbi:MAG TPA: hypothetical protein VF214_03610 [Edaphobacter sp.]